MAPVGICVRIVTLEDSTSLEDAQRDVVARDASVSLGCAFVGALARARTAQDAALAPPDPFVEQQREARRLRRSWDSKMSWRVRKRAGRGGKAEQ